MDKIVSLKSSINQIKNQFDSQDFLYRLLNEIKEKYWDEFEKKAYEYFSSLHDSLYHDILFKKVSISLETRKLLERLATPKNKNKS